MNNSEQLEVKRGQGNSQNHNGLKGEPKQMDSKQQTHASSYSGVKSKRNETLTSLNNENECNKPTKFSSEDEDDESPLRFHNMVATNVENEQMDTDNGVLLKISASQKRTISSDDDWVSTPIRKNRRPSLTKTKHVPNVAMARSFKPKDKVCTQNDKTPHDFPGKS